MMLNAFAQEVITRFPLGFVATVDAEGRPHVSPKGTFLVLDDNTVAFGDIRSPGTLANLAHLAECEVNFVDPFLRKGVRLRGPVTVHDRDGAAFDALIGRWHDVWGDLANRVSRLVVVAVTEAAPLSTPPYDEGATEAGMIALYKRKYAEIYP